MKKYINHQHTTIDYIQITNTHLHTQKTKITTHPFWQRKTQNINEFPHPKSPPTLSQVRNPATPWIATLHGNQGFRCEKKTPFGWWLLKPVNHGIFWTYQLGDRRRVFSRSPETSTVSYPKNVILPCLEDYPIIPPFHSWPFHGFPIEKKSSGKIAPWPHLKIDNSACPWHP